jgi:hypothetical protein
VRQAQLLARLRQQVAAASGAAPLPVLPPLGYRLDGFSTAPALSFSAVQAQVQQQQQRGGDAEQESDAQLLRPFQACYAAPESLDQEYTGLAEGSTAGVMQLPASSALLTVHSGFSDGMDLALLFVMWCRVCVAAHTGVAASVYSQCSYNSASVITSVTLSMCA